jgi:hypothetical protein
VIGMLAKGGRPGDDAPDVVRSCEPISDREAAKSEALDMILNSVEPGIAGVEIKTILHGGSEKKGYVVIHVPESESTPRRTKTDWKFYVRITSGTVPMEYFQIEDRFGRRPHPKLVLEMSPEAIGQAYFPFSGIKRTVLLSIRNDGRGIARFPCLRVHNRSTFKVRNHPMVPGSPVWPVHALSDWTSIRGSANDVIYPGELFEVATITQDGVAYRDIGQGQRHTGNVQNPNAWDFDATDLEIELLCDDMPPHRQILQFKATNYKKL